MKADTDRRLVTVGRLFYEEQLSKTEIATRLSISVTHVNRLLREAARRGIVSIKISAPRFEDLEHSISDRYGLREVRVVSAAETESDTRLELGLAAAHFFDSTVVDGKTIGLGSGRTLFEMVTAIREEPRKVEIFPISLFAEQSTLVTGVDANTVVNILWFKTRPESRAQKFSLFFPDESTHSLEEKVEEVLSKNECSVLRERLAALDYYFVSCSGLRSDSHLVALSSTYGISLHELKTQGIIGDIALHTIDVNGSYVPARIENVLFRLGYEALREAVKRKHVVLIAGGPSKVAVIRAGLQAQLFNSLITDDETANALVNAA